MTLDFTKPPFQTERGEPVHFIGMTSSGKVTVWEYKDGAVFLRNADGRVYGDRPDGEDVINAPPPKVKETLWAVIYPPVTGLVYRGYLYSTPDQARANDTPGVIAAVPVEVEYTPKEPK